MAKLTAARRNALSEKSFALPGRRYPIEDRSHAANALARVSQHGTAHEKAEVRAKVHAKYPSMGKHEHDGSSMHADHPMLHSDHFHMNRHRG
jgi:hypothetical protein